MAGIGPAVANEERHEVWYTDKVGHRRYQNALGGHEDAMAVAKGFVDEGMSDVEIHRVVTAREPVAFTPPADDVAP